ncbi:hypothetical protein GIB67_018925 [Kingdonia uniflora]|uniref:ACT domain-containing protein ACR n=1 Tax=Kingdonia uniflora TaxID=39325 RepID=A0A7J7L2L9_9MAGN|nr:hypothetical protein GIB67_018925 [Kingdonia uniflora]
MVRVIPTILYLLSELVGDVSIEQVDSANQNGILLEMVQVLTDLDLVISKSYISSDGGWFMDVFHVTDQLGNKVTDDILIHYIQQALCPGRSPGKAKVKAKAKAKEVQKSLGRMVGPSFVCTDLTTLEMTANDRPGLLSEVSAVMAELGFHVAAAEAWTHNHRAACIIYVEDELTGGGPITDRDRLTHAEEQLEHVVGAHHGVGESMRVSLTPPASGRIHPERRLHQLMYADRDYEECESCSSNSSSNKTLYGTQVSIENCSEKGYSVVNMRSRDRPKLLFDTVCTLTDMQYVVFHAAVSSKGSFAVQEYYIRHKDGCTLDTESERQRVSQCLIAAIERRVSHGLRLDIHTRDRVGLLSDVTRIFRENGLAVSRAEIGTRGERAIGSFYVTDASGNEVDPRTIQLLRNEIGETVLEVNNSQVWLPRSMAEPTPVKPYSLSTLLWSQLERFSSNFSSIKS